MLKSTAISDAGLTNETIFEVERKQFTKTTYDCALESANTVNAEIETLIRRLGQGVMSRKVFGPLTTDASKRSRRRQRQHHDLIVARRPLMAAPDIISSKVVSPSAPSAPR